jgi:hypothetical protein
MSARRVITSKISNPARSSIFHPALAMMAHCERDDGKASGLNDPVSGIVFGTD